MITYESIYGKIKVFLDGKYVGGILTEAVPTNIRCVYDLTYTYHPWHAMGRYAEPGETFYSLDECKASLSD